jgi:hypothetical protein
LRPPLNGGIVGQTKMSVDRDLLGPPTRPGKLAWAIDGLLFVLGGVVLLIGTIEGLKAGRSFRGILLTVWGFSGAAALVVGIVVAIAFCVRRLD